MACLMFYFGQPTKNKTMCKKSLTTGKKISLIVLSVLVVLFIQPFVMASNGDKDSCIGSEKATQKVENESKSEALYSNAASLQEASENEMEIENWMLNPDNACWQENEMSLEKWMYDVHSTSWEETLTDDSEEYAIEDWMLNPSAWIKNTPLFAGIND